MCGLVAALAAPAGAVDFHLRWTPMKDPRVVAYDVYVWQAGKPTPPPRNAGLPPIETDGAMSFVASGYSSGIPYHFAVTGAAADGSQSAPSNEIVICISAADCDDHNPCTADACVNGQCQHPPGLDGVSCSNGDPCDGEETCASGVCRPGIPLTCDDGDPCTTDSCSAGVCTHASSPACAACDGATAAGLDATQVTLVRSTYGIRMTARGNFVPEHRVTPSTTGLSLQIGDAYGTPYYAVVVPPGAMEKSRAGETYRLRSSASSPEGLGILRVRVRPDGTVAVSARGVAARAPRLYPAPLVWTLAFGDQCGADTCMAFQRKSDCH